MIRSAKPPGFLLGVVMTLQLSACAPLINDISTDLNDPPTLRRVRSDLSVAEAIPYPPEFGRIQSRAYADLSPLMLEGIGHEAAMALIQKVLEEMPRVQIVLHELNKTEVSNRSSHLQAVFTTRIFRFRDDVAIRVRAYEKGQQVDIRSRSRLGKGDLGTNAARIHTLIAAMQQAIADRNL